jgi:hypothetical protein
VFVRGAGQGPDVGYRLACTVLVSPPRVREEERRSDSAPLRSVPRKRNLLDSFSGGNGGSWGLKVVDEDQISDIHGEFSTKRVKDRGKT